MAALGRLDLRQQLHAEIGREGDRHDPRRDQSKADNPKDIAGVFTRARPGEADGQKARDRHQGSGQHRRRGMAPGIGCGSNAVHASFHLHHHHLDRDDGIVDEQSERENHGAERDAVEHPICVEHNEKHDCER